MPNIQAERIPARRACYCRDGLVGRLAGVLADDGSKPVPLLGGPGLGKTTVLIAVLHHRQVEERFGKCRHFVTCNGARSRRDMVARIAQAIGITPTRYLDEMVFESLSNGPTLLVIDDAETLSDVAEMDDMMAELAGLDNLVLLVAFRGSHTRFDLEWHEPFHVLPFDPREARETFLYVAGKRHEADPFARRLLEAVDGVPFAVIVFGHLAQSEPDLRGLWDAWCKRRTRVLETPEVVRKFEVMAASFEVSIGSRFVDEQARRLLGLLGRLPDGLIEKEITVMCPGIATTACGSLRRAGLILPNERSLRLHGVLREYVREKHPPCPDDLRCILEYYATLARQEADEFHGRNADSAVLKFAANLGNIEAAIETGLDTGVRSLAADAAAALAAYICLTGAGSRDLVRTVESSQVSLPPLSRACLLRNCADLETRYGDRGHAYELYETAQELFRDSQMSHGEADCIKKIADLDRQNGELAKAVQGYHVALRMHERLNNLVGRAGCIAGIADTAVIREQYPEAHDRFSEALELSRQADNDAGMAYCSMRLGYIALAADELEEAVERLEQAIPLAGSAHDLLIKASAMQGLGMAEERVGHLDRAKQHFEQALPFFQRVDDTFGIGGCLRGLGDVARTQGDNGLARQHYLEAFQIYRRGPHWPDIAEINHRLASVTPVKEEQEDYESKAREADQYSRRTALSRP